MSVGIDDIREQVQAVCGTTNQLLLALGGGNVRRYHAAGAAARDLDQNNAEHTWRALVILLYLWPDARREVILAMVYHDTPEFLTGDINAVFKRTNGVVGLEFSKLETAFLVLMGCYEHIPSLTEIERSQLLVSDCLEAYFHCCERPPSMKSREIKTNLLAIISQVVERLFVEDQGPVHEVIALAQSLSLDYQRS